jgi:hypothetical protein
LDPVRITGKGLEMNFFRIVVGTPTRKGGLLNQVERFIKTEADINFVRGHFSASYSGLTVQASIIESFESLELPVKEPPKVGNVKEVVVEQFYRVNEIDIKLTETQEALVKELEEIERQRYKKDEALKDDLRTTWKEVWWLDNGHTKTFERRGSYVYLKDARIKWTVILAKSTREVEK